MHLNRGMMAALLCFSLFAAHPQHSTHSSAHRARAEPQRESEDRLLLDAKAYFGDTGLGLKKGKSGKPALSGRIERGADLERIQKFRRKHPEIEDDTSFSSKARGQIGKYLRRKLKKLAPEAEIEESGSGEFVIFGTSSEDILSELKKIYPLIRLAQTLPTQKDTIQPSVLLQIELVEIKKSALEKLGSRLNSPVNVNGAFAFRVLPKSSSAAIVGTGDPVRSFLDLALQNGEARIHAKESVLTENGKLGEFQAGGEFPIKVSGISSMVEFKNYGLILRFRPVLLRPPLIHLEIHSEMSEIDMGSLVDGIPVISKKELNTQVSTRLNQTIALAGLVRCSQSLFKDRIPGLSSVPGLGRLFRSEDFKDQRSEAYLLITPTKLSEAWLPTPEL